MQCDVARWKHEKKSCTRAPKIQGALTATTNSTSSASARRTADRSATGESRVQAATTPGTAKRKPALYNHKIGWELQRLWTTKPALFTLLLGASQQKSKSGIELKRGGSPPNSWQRYSTPGELKYSEDWTRIATCRQAGGLEQTRFEVFNGTDARRP